MGEGGRGHPLVTSSARIWWRYLVGETSGMLAMCRTNRISAQIKKLPRGPPLAHFKTMFTGFEGEGGCPGVTFLFEPICRALCAHPLWLFYDIVFLSSKKRVHDLQRNEASLVDTTYLQPPTKM